MSSSPSLVRRLVREHLAVPGPLALSVIGGLGLAAARLRLSWLLKDLGEGPLSGRAPLAPLAGEALLVMAAGAWCLFVSRAELARVREAVSRRLRDRAQAALLAADLRHRGREGDELSRLVSDVPALGGFATQVLKRHVGDGAVVAGGAILALALDPHLALLGGGLLVLAGAALLGSGRMARRLGTQTQDALGGLAATLAEQIQGLRTVKGLGMEEAEAARFAAAARALRVRRVASDAWAGVVGGGLWLLTGGALLLLLAGGASAVTSGRLTPGAFLAFAVIAIQVLEPLRRLGEAHAALQASLGAAARVYELIDRPSEAWPGGAGLAASPRAGGASVRFEGVRFAFPGGPPVLAGLDLDLAAGERVGLVGTTGAGKSTLAALLGALYPAEGGRILLDGEDLTTLPLARIRREVCIVEQDPFLRAASVLENVAPGAGEISRARVEAALAATGFDAVARRLPSGLDTLLAEGGRDLSSGERQRLALARAVLRNPRLLVLDESTSGLDPAAEEGLFAGLDPWLAGRTVLVIAHRLSTVARCPRVVVLDEGRVVADGPPAVLHAEPGRFRDLFAGP